MENSISQLFQNSPLQGAAVLALACVGFLLVGVLPGVGLLYVVYYLLTLPLRRKERVRLLLDLIESGLRQGRTPEASIIALGRTYDPVLGPRFLVFARLVQSGMGIAQALDQVPRLAPAQVRAVLATGERIGDLGKVLPACRLLLQDSVSQVRGALNYLLVLSVLASPAMIVIPLILKVKVMPSFAAVFAGMTEGAQLPALTRFVFASDWLFLAAETGLFAVIWTVTLIYIFGPRLRDMLEGVFMGRTGWVDGLSYNLPWRRKRLQRDFSAMLAVMLDASVPEPEAVRLAAQSTANRILRQRAARCCSLLEKGVPLPKSLEVIEKAPEFRWRLQNALHRGNGFTRALAGWHEVLDAKAFQLEQAAAQVFTTTVVLASGIIVALILIAMFLPLIRIITQVSLW